MDELGGLSGERRRDRRWPAAVGFGVLFAFISGGLLSATDAYRLLLFDDAAVLGLGPFIAAAWVAAGFLTGRHTASVRAGALAAAIAAISGTLLAVAVDQWLIHATISQWLAHVNAGLTPADSPIYQTANNAYTAELGGMLVSVITLPLIGAVLGWFGSLLGVGRGAARLTAEATSRSAAMRAMPDDYSAEVNSQRQKLGGSRVQLDMLFRPSRQVLPNELPRTDDPNLG